MLEVRPVSSGGGEKPWTAAVCAAPRRWFHVCFNPTGTRTLAAQTLVERLYLAAVNDDVGTGDAITARALVGNFVETVATNELRIGAEMCWQWRIVVRTDHSERVVATGEVRS